ncbi:MAG: HAD-IIA family hydrolase [Aquiluna sp.]
MLIDNFDSLFLDLDGVVYRGAKAISGAVEAINRADELGKKIGYLTNNASRTQQAIAEQLNSYGLSVTPEQIIGSAAAGVRLLETMIPAGSKVLVVGGEGLRKEVIEAGFELAKDSSAKPDAVIQGFSKDVGWQQLAEAAFAIQAGAVWVATNQDWTLPLERGIAPGNGTLVGAVHTAVGILPEFAGKPFRPIFDAALQQMQVQRPLMIGDRLDTDIKGAITAGIQSATVMTGVVGNRELLGAKTDERPNFVLTDMNDLFAEYPEAKPTKHGVRVGKSEVELLGDRVLLTAGHPEAIDTLRAATNLIWTSGRPIYGLQVDAELLGVSNG